MRIAVADMPKENYNFELTTRLDGTRYILHFMWNELAGYWFLNFKSSANIMLVSGIKVVSMVPLLNRYTIEGLPKGDLIVFNDDLVDPGKDAWGHTHKLYYMRQS